MADIFLCALVLGASIVIISAAIRLAVWFLSED